MADDLEALFTSLLILASPVIFAMPVSVAWRWWVGIEPEHNIIERKLEGSRLEHAFGAI